MTTMASRGRRLSYAHGPTPDTPARSSRLVLGSLVIADHAKQLLERDLPEDTVDTILYLDGWDRFEVGRRIGAWLSSLSGHAASIAAAGLRRNPDAAAHFSHLARDAQTDYRIRRAVQPPS